MLIQYWRHPGTLQPDFAAPLHALGPFPRIFSFVQPRLKDRFAVAAPPSSSPPQSPSQPVNLVRRRLQKYRYISPSPSPPPPPLVQRAVHAACTAAQRGVQAAQVNSHMCAKPAPRARQARRPSATSGTASRFARPPAPLLGGTVHGTAHPIVRHSPMQMLEMSRVRH